jgi:hypothetical protein
MLIVSGIGGQGVVNRLLSRPPAVFVGLISYSLYLWHWPLIVFGRYYLDRDFQPLEAAGLVVLSFAAAVVSYRFVERPFRRSEWVPRGTAPMPRRGLRRPAAAFGLAMLLMCGSLGVGMGLNGWSWRLPESAVIVDQLSGQFDPFREPCHGVEKALLEKSECTIGVVREDRSFDVAVIGDSHAEVLIAAFDKLLKPRGLSGRQVTTNGCVPLFDVRVISGRGVERCRDFAETVSTFLERHDQLEFVVLSARWALYSETRWLEGESAARRFLVDAQDQSLTLENSRRALSEGLERTVELLTARGLRVLLIAQVPPLSSRRARCVAWARWHGEDESSCHEPAAAARARTAFGDALIARIAAGNDRVEAFFPGNILCDAVRCTPVLDGIYLFRDEDHLNPAGAELLLSHLALPAR